MNITEQITQEIRDDLALIEEKVTVNVTIADLIRMGAPHTVQSTNWGHGREACALSAAGLAAKALGYIE